MAISVSTPAPYTFDEWASRQYPVALSRADAQYTTYLKDWYENSPDKSLREDYREFVRYLSTIFKSDADYVDVSHIDFTDRRSLLQAIPVFVSNLRKLALKIAQDRETLKQSKIRYNLKGTALAVEREVKNILGTEYGTHLGDTPVEIMVCPVWDDTDYFTTTNTLTSFDKYEGGIALPKSPSNPLYDVFAEYLSQNPSLSAYTANAELMGEARDAFAGCDIYSLSGDQLRQTVASFDLSLRQGGNIFYWPQGTLNIAEVSAAFDPISIHDTNFIADGATAGTTVADADLIWQTNGIDYEGAWLEHREYDVRNSSVECYLKPQDSLVFKWPFCGHGIYANGVWSGPAISNINEDTTINNIEVSRSLYWGTSFTDVSSTVAIGIHETTLISSGIHSGSNPVSADEILVSTTNTATPTAAWCYEVRETQLPITAGTNYINWPYFSGIVDDTDFDVLSSMATPVPLSSIDMWLTGVGSVAGSGVGNADIIYKRGCDEVDEGAYLYACNSDSIDADFTVGNVQPGLSFRMTPGWNTFVYGEAYTGPTGMLINSIDSFRGISHESFCDYLKTSADYLTSKNQKKSKSAKWSECNCRSVYYSPLGHNGARFNTIKGGADFIIEGEVDPASFNIDLWRDSEGNSWDTSPKFAWFKLSATGSLKMDYGPGSWQCIQPFALVPGVKYTYFRAAPCCDGSSTAPLVINWGYCNCSTTPVAGCNVCQHPWKQPILQGFCGCEGDTVEQCCRPEWRKLVRNAAGDWIPTEEPSDMILNAGDVLEYIHQKEYSLGTATVETKHSAVDFVWNVPVTADPFWADSDPICHPVRNYRTVYDYLIVTQPVPSKIVLQDGHTVSITHKSAAPMIWSQPITLSVYQNTKEWKRLVVNKDVSSAFVNRAINSTTCTPRDLISYGIIEGTSETSALDLRQKDSCGNVLKTFYCAKSPFDTSHDLVVTKGNGVNIEDLLYNTAATPWRNLTGADEVMIGYRAAKSELRTSREIGRFARQDLATTAFENAEMTLSTLSASEGVMNDYRIWPTSKDYIWIQYNDAGVRNNTSGYAAGIPDGLYDDFKGYKGQVVPFELYSGYESCSGLNDLDSMLSQKVIKAYSQDIYGGEYALYKDPQDTVFGANTSDTGVIIYRDSAGIRLFADQFDASVTLYDYHVDHLTSQVSAEVIDFSVHQDVVFIQTSSAFVIDWVVGEGLMSGTPTIYNIAGKSLLSPKLHRRNAYWGILDTNGLSLYRFDCDQKTNTPYCTADTMGIFPFDSIPTSILHRNADLNQWDVTMEGTSSHDIVFGTVIHSISGEPEIHDWHVHQTGLSATDFRLLKAVSTKDYRFVFGECSVGDTRFGYASGGRSLVSLRFDQ